jgi:hypothetical protein
MIYNPFGVKLVDMGPGSRLATDAERQRCRPFFSVALPARRAWPAPVSCRKDHYPASSTAFSTKASYKLWLVNKVWI